MTGRSLRGRVDAFDDVLMDVEDFLKGEGVVIEEGFIDMIREDLGCLFYLIPLEEDGDDKT